MKQKQASSKNTLIKVYSRSATINYQSYDFDNVKTSVVDIMVLSSSYLIVLSHNRHVYCQFMAYLYHNSSAGPFIIQSLSDFYLIKSQSLYKLISIKPCLVQILLPTALSSWFLIWACLLMSRDSLPPTSPRVQGMVSRVALETGPWWCLDTTSSWFP